MKVGSSWQDVNRWNMKMIIASQKNDSGDLQQKLLMNGANALWMKNNITAISHNNHYV